MTEPRNPLTTHQIESAKSRYEAGERMSTIARHLRVRPDWLKCLIDPEHDMRRRKTRMESARRRRATQPKLPAVLHADAHESRVVVPRDVLLEKHRAFARPQTVSAFLMGEPLPGRSALDRMQRQ